MGSKDRHPEVKSQQGRMIVWMLIAMGFPHHRVASLFDCNQGRVAEVMNEAPWKPASTA